MRRKQAIHICVGPAMPGNLVCNGVLRHKETHPTSKQVYEQLNGFARAKNLADQLNFLKLAKSNAPPPNPLTKFGNLSILIEVHPLVVVKACGLQA
jgi:hypothetical protein